MKGLRLTVFLMCVLALGLLPGIGQAAPGDVVVVAGNGTAGYSGDGAAATAARLSNPNSVVVDSVGNFYIADANNNCVRKVTAADGKIITYAGTGTAGYTGDGFAANAATLKDPNGVALDASGNLYIADSGNKSIRKVTTDGKISTVVGPSTGADLVYPMSVAVDGAGTNIYIADFSSQYVKKVNAGTTPILVSTLTNPSGVALDANGNLFMVEAQGSKRLLKRSTAGAITTVTTFGSQNVPHGLAVDNAGYVYIADLGSHSVQKVAAAGGVVSTVVDSSKATPSGVAVDAAGNLFIADGSSNQIKKLVESIVPVVTVLPLGGHYTTAQNVAFTSSKKATIYYTTDGSVPTTSSTSFDTTGHLTVFTDGETITYFAVDADGNRSFGLDTDGVSHIDYQQQVYFFKASTPPGAPTAVTAVAGNGQATVSFTAPAANGGGVITDYVITVSTVDGIVTSLPVDATTTHVITGLTNGTSYTFTVMADNFGGFGPDSAPSNAVTPAPPTVPGAPTGVSATAGNAQVIVSFVAPANGGSAITSYTVTSSPDNITKTGASSPLTVSGLVNGRVYSFTVTATNGVGTGAASSPSASVIPTQKPGDCDGSGTVSSAEVQSAINMSLGMKAVSPCVDLDGSGVVSSAELQKVINSSLGM